MNERIKQLREYLKLSQIEFSSKVNIGRSTLSMFESGQRDLKDIHISQICSEFNVNENWLRYGNGEMFIQSDTFSLDEYAKQNNLTSLELDIVKAYISLDSNVRKDIMNSLKSIFDAHSEVTAAKDKDIKNTIDIDKEVEAYRLELEAEQKGITLSAYEDIKGFHAK